MRADERLALRERFVFRCGYCGVSESGVGAELTVDHFRPRSHGGRDEADNWVYCCHACNEFKGNFWQPASPRRILHPLRDTVAEHSAENEQGVLLPLTATGAFHIQRLRLNRPALIAHRRERRLLDVAWQEQERLLQRMDQLEQQVQNLTDQIERSARD